MKVKEALAGFGGFLIGGAFIVLMLAIGGVIIFGLAWASSKLLPWLSTLTWVTLAVIVFIVLPLAIPRATRGGASIALLIACHLFGVTLWMEGLVLTWAIWGYGAAIFGILIAGVGVVSIAVLATLLEGMWSELIELLVLLIMTFGSLMGGISLANSLES